jgi:hypothetical protein
MKWPEPENKLIPEGHYTFRLNKEPEFRKFTYNGKDGQKEGIKVILYLSGLNEKGEFRHIEGIPVWDTRYAKLCEVLGVEHGKDIEMAESVIDGDIKHEADKNDPTKTYARLYGIVPHIDVAEVPDPSDGDVPF